jgi:hypothetical protein
LTAHFSPRTLSGNGEFSVLVAGIVGILIAVCIAARAFLNSAGALPF